MSNTIQHINKGKAVVVHLGAGWGERLRFTLEAPRHELAGPRVRRSDSAA